MKQILRLIGMPDKMIGFDELPEDLLSDLEMQNEKSLPRYWRDWIGERERVIKIKSYVDPMTKKLIECEPIREKGSYTWTVDWEINSNQEAWSKIVSYTRQNVKEGFRLLDRLEDMAKPMSTNVSESITLEPEDILIIPLKSIEKPKEEGISPVAEAPKEQEFKCPDCEKPFSSKQAVRLHRTKKHPEKVAV